MLNVVDAFSSVELKLIVFEDCMMTPQEFRAALLQTISDHRLSRAERQALMAVFKEMKPSTTELDLYRHEAFDVARDHMPPVLSQQDVIDWLEDVIRLFKPAVVKGDAIRSEAHFSPGTACRQRIKTLFQQSRRTIDVCVFTITDDEISEAIAEACNRGVRVRILSDDRKSTDTGSDVERLTSHGIEVRLDTSPYHMHHKFAIFDGEIVLTGSYNWTRSAADKNEENIVILSDPELLRSFGREFEKLWSKYD